MSGQDNPRATPEALARAAWEDRLNSLEREREHWRLAAMAALLVAAVSVGFGVWAAVRTEYVPYLVMVDELNRPAAALAPREITEWPDQVVKQQLATFLRDWRSVSTDRTAMEGSLQRIQFFLEPNSAADRKVIAWARDPETNPFRLAETRTADVEVVAVNFLRGRSWLAEWTETRRNRGSGRIETVRRFQGTFVLGRRAVRDDAVLLHNPLGMIVEDFDIVGVQ